MNRMRSISRVWALLTAVVMLACAMSATVFAAEDAITTVGDSGPTTIVEMDGNYYEHLQEAIEAIPVGGTATITLLKDAVDPVPVEIGERVGSSFENGNKKITLDLNGHTLELGGGEGLHVYDNSELSLEGEGELNIVGNVGAEGNSKITVSNVKFGIVLAMHSSEITVRGDVEYLKPKHKAASHPSSRGSMTMAAVESWYSSNVLVEGSVRNNQAPYGVEVTYGGTLTVGGDVIVEEHTMMYGGGITASDGTVVVRGDVLVSPPPAGLDEEDLKVERIGVKAESTNCEITIDGTLSADPYITFSRKVLTPYDYDAVTTKEGYVTYSSKESQEGTRSYVWIKGEPPKKPVTPPSRPSDNDDRDDDYDYDYDRDSISMKDDNSKPVDKSNPNTGASDFVGLSVALGVISLAAIAAITMKK